jgi:hypothetical protein
VWAGRTWRAGLSDRITFLEGDFHVDPLGGGYDFVFVSSIIHSYTPALNRALLERCAAALAPGGVVAVKDFFVAPDRSGPVFSLLFGINMLVNTEGSPSRRPRMAGGAGLGTAGNRGRPAASICSANRNLRKAGRTSDLWDITVI